MIAFQVVQVMLLSLIHIYKAAIRKLRKQLNGGAYGQWLSIQKAIRKARADTEANSGYYVPPQTTWLDEKELAERFLCEVDVYKRQGWRRGYHPRWRRHRGGDEGEEAPH